MMTREGLGTADNLDDAILPPTPGATEIVLPEHLRDFDPLTPLQRALVQDLKSQTNPDVWPSPHALRRAQRIEARVLCMRGLLRAERSNDTSNNFHS